jgi:hypothetical protein
MKDVHADIMKTMKVETASERIDARIKRWGDQARQSEGTQARN